MLSDEQMSKRWPFSLLNDEQMSNKVGVEHQPVEGFYYCSMGLCSEFHLASIQANLMINFWGMMNIE